jgi:hypothetical protein
MEHIAQKYGSSPADIERNRENIRARGAELGFEFNMQKRGTIALKPTFENRDPGND